MGLPARWGAIVLEIRATMTAGGADFVRIAGSVGKTAATPEFDGPDGRPHGQYLLGGPRYPAQPGTGDGGRAGNDLDRNNCSANHLFRAQL